MYERKTHDEWTIESWDEDLKTWSLEAHYNNIADWKRDIKTYIHECPDMKFRFRKVRVKNV